MILMDDQYRFKDFGLVQEEGHDHPPMPIFNRKTIHIPGRSGIWYFGSEIQEKNFNIPLGTQGSDRVRLQQQLNDFVDFLFDEYGQPREFKIIFDYEPDKYYMVKISEQFNPERVRPFARFVLPLVANYPYKKLIVDSDEITWGSTVIKFNSTSITFGHSAIGLRQITSPQNITYTVLGKALRPTFTINGSANGLTLKANGKSISLPNFNNTNWVIDGKSYSVKRNGLDTVLDGIDFIEFLKGENNLIIEGSNLDFSLTVKYKDIFL